MEAKIDRLTKEFDEFKREWDRVFKDFRELSRNIEELNRELGVQRGRLMFDQIDRMEQRQEQIELKFNKVLHTVEHTKRLMEFNGVNMKEVMKALSLIYRNTDEIEDDLLDDGRSTR
ncbi:MAG: hypothetical protein ACE5DX_03485 [Candidatus Dojkabacteria bacterium]